MPILSHIMKIFGKEDIIFTCRFCQKTGSKSWLRAFHGYECMIKPKKRSMGRCRRCYFGKH